MHFELLIANVNFETGIGFESILSSGSISKLCSKKISSQ